MKIRQFITILLLFVLLTNSLLSQNPKIDSLENLLNIHTKQDTVRVNLLNKISNILYNFDTDKT